MSPTKPDPLPCREIVARAVDPDQLKNSVPKSVRKNAFIPRAHGQDDAGLSVSVVGPKTLELLRLRTGAPQKEAVTLHVGRVREISVEGYRLDVGRDPIEGDPDHALIIGFPRRHPDESTREKATWNRLAELLAQQARCCLEI